MPGQVRDELVEIQIPLSVLDLVEVLLWGSIDAKLRVYRPAEPGPFEAKPAFRKNLDVPFSLETFRPIGFLPTLGYDLNGDGYKDLLSSAGGKSIEVFLGEPGGRIRKRTARQKLDTRGSIRFGNLNGDDLVDFVIVDTRHPDTPVRVVVNRGVLPGTRRTPELKSSEGESPAADS